MSGAGQPTPPEKSGGLRPGGRGGLPNSLNPPPENVGGGKQGRAKGFRQFHHPPFPKRRRRERALLRVLAKLEPPPRERKWKDRFRAAQILMNYRTLSNPYKIPTKSRPGSHQITSKFLPECNKPHQIEQKSYKLLIIPA